MKLAVIFSDYGAAIHMGAAVETKVRTFDLPDEIAEHIKRAHDNCCTVSLAIVEEEKDQP